MESLLEKHGEVLIYGIVGVIMVLMVFGICNSKWKKIMPEYKLEKSKDNSNFIENNIGKSPVIEADEIVYANYKSDSFNCMDYIKAKNSSGKDITSMVKVYGKVDTYKKGIYKLRCTVFDNQSTCTKYINVIVE